MLREVLRRVVPRLHGRVRDDLRAIVINEAELQGADIHQRGERERSDEQGTAGGAVFSAVNGARIRRCNGDFHAENRTLPRS